MDYEQYMLDYERRRRASEAAFGLPAGFELEDGAAALPPASPVGPFPGMVQPGNIDLNARPLVRNSDGSYSTVRSMSFGNDAGQEILVPTVSPDGRIMSDQEAMERYGQTGQTLGKFDTPAHADMYAEALHKAQDQHYGPLTREVPPGFEIEQPVAQPMVPQGFEIEQPAPVAAPSTDPADMSYLDRFVVNPLGRGKNNIIDQSVNTAGLLTGILSPEEFAAATVQDAKDAASYPQHPDDAASLERISQAPGFEDAAKHYDELAANMTDPYWKGVLEQQAARARNSKFSAMLDEGRKNPASIVTTAVESLPTIPVTVGGAAAGAAAGSLVEPGGGTVVGGALGAGLGSGTTEFLTSLTDYLRENGKATDEASLAAAVRDPEIMAAARGYALKRGASVGIFDALGAGVAGRIAGPVANKLGGGVPAHLAGAGAEALAQGGTGAAGEAAGQLTTKGKIDKPGDVFLEAAAEIPGAAVEVPGIVAGRHAGEHIANAIKPTEQAAPATEQVPAGFELEQPQAPVKPAEPVAAPAPAPVENTAPQTSAVNPEPTPVAPGGSVDPVQPAGPVAPAPTEPQPVQQPQAAATPAPAPAPVETGSEAASMEAPKRERITTPDGDFETDVEFQVVEADSLKAAQGELQPRDRASRVGSDLQIQNMASKLDPLRLMGSRESDRGAPVVDEEGTILSGNGRAAAIMASMDSHPERYAAYRTSLQQMGYNVEGMKAPVLVRRAVGISPEDKRRFATRSNSDGGLGLSPTERAGIEQDYVTPDMLARFDADVEGGVSAASNGGFVRDFLRRVPTNEQASFVNKDGQLTPLGAQRIAGAIFARAYGEKSLVERFVEDEKDPALRNALTGAAAAWAHMREAITDKSLDITPDLVQAVSLINRAKNAGMTIANFTAQSDAFNETPKRVQDIARLFFNNTGNRLAAWRDIRDRLQSYAQQASRTANAEGDIFGGPKPTPESILSGIVQGADRKANVTQNAGPETSVTEPQNGGELFSGKETLSRPPMRGGKVEQKKAAGPSLLDAVANDNTDDEIDAEPTDHEDSTRAPRGSLTPQTEQVSFTNRASMYEEAYRVAGLTPDEGTLLAPAQKRNVLRRVLVQTFGFKNVDLDVKGAKISTLEAADQMLDAYRNVRFMMHALQLPIKAISLDGTLTLALERFKGKYFGAYNPGTKTIHMPGRSNSFAHEWAHALDHFLLDRLKPATKEHLLSQAARNEGLDPTQSLDAAFVNLIHTMFYNEADLALRVMQLEQEANKTVQHGPNAGQPTQSALKAQEQIDRLTNGSTRLRIKPSDFRQNSANYAPQAAGYFASVHEMLARAFEAYTANRVEALGGGNEFITKGEQNYLGGADRRLAMTFPKADERLRIFAALDDVFHHVRTQQLLGTEAAAERPEDVDIVDPQYWNRIVAEQGEPGLLRQIADEAMKVRNVFKNETGASLKDRLKSSVSQFALQAGINTGAGLRGVGRSISDIARHMLGSARGVMKAINKRNAGKGGEFLDFITNKLQTDIGTGRENTVTYEEARERHTLQTAAKIDSVLKATDLGYNLKEEVNDRVRSLLYGEKVTAATSQEKSLAAELRRIFNDTYRKAKDAGLNIGFVEDKGYLPRILQTLKVQTDPEGFVRDATKLYHVVYDKLTADIDPDETLALATRLSNRVAPETTARNDGPYAAAIKKLRKAMKREEQAIAAATANPMSAQAGQEAADAQQAREDAHDELIAALRDDYARTSAEDWKGRVLIGDSNTYDSHGPDSNFTKERKLPPEADDILKEWYDNDVLHLTLSYAHHVSSRAAYQERFGAGGGNKKLDAVIHRQDVRDAIQQNPTKYDPKSPAGRLNILRDLANPKADNVLEMALWEAQQHGADGRDVRTIRGVVEDFTGRKARSPLSDVGDKLSGLVYMLTYVTLLPRAAITAVTEPLTTMMRTGSMKATLHTLNAYVMEAVRTAKTTQERAALARAIGLVSTPLHDMVLMNRLSSDFGHVVSGNVILARFFRANGLTQLTNAQRRAVMAGGFYWLRDMGKAITDPNADDIKKNIARAEFRDLGVPNDHLDSLADWIAQHDEHPTLDELETGPGKMYADAVARYVDQTIQNPRRADKPLAAASPMGRMIYALTSYLYTFWRNVHLAAVNRTIRNYGIAREGGAGRASAAVEAGLSPLATLAGGFTLMFAGQLLVTTLREAIFNREQWDKKDDDERRKWLMMLAGSRTGWDGPADVLVNALTGLRYERDLANMGVGPGLSYYISQIQNVLIAMGAGRNSDKNNTAERTGMKSLYRLTVAPALSMGLTALNASGPVGWIARYAGLTTVTSNSAADKFADWTVGEADSSRAKKERGEN